MKLAALFLVLSLTVLTYGSTVSAAKNNKLPAAILHAMFGDEEHDADPGVDDNESELSDDKEDSPEDSDKPVSEREEQSADEDDDQEKAGDPFFWRRRRYVVRRRRYYSRRRSYYSYGK